MSAPSFVARVAPFAPSAPGSGGRPRASVVSARHVQAGRPVRRWALAASITACAAALPALMIPGSADAAYPGRDGLIAFNSQYDCTWSSLATIQPDGRAFRWIRPAACDTSDDGTDRWQVTWSPDGRHLYFAEGTRPAVVNADGSGFRLLRRAPAVPETWAPDGRHFAYTREAANGRGSVWVATIDGAENRRLGFGAFPSWSPDGRSIAYMTTGESEGRLWLRDARTGRPLRRLSRRCGPSDWSPDSRRIVCADVDYSRNLYVLDVTGRRQRQRITTGSEVDNPQWAPDGRRIAFVKTYHPGENEQASIWTVTPRGRAPKRVYTSSSLPEDLLNYGMSLAWQPKPIGNARPRQPCSSTRPSPAQPPAPASAAGNRERESRTHTALAVRIRS